MSTKGHYAHPAAVVAALLMAVIGVRRGASRRVRTPSAALRPLIVELRAMRLLVWFPLVILLFQLTERAILTRDAVRRRHARTTPSQAWRWAWPPCSIRSGRKA